MQQALSEHAGKRGEVELHEIGKLGVEHPLECLPHRRMVASEREHSPATEQVQILLALRVVKILSASALVLPVKAHGAQHPHHLLV